MLGVHRSQFYYHKKQQQKETAARDALRQKVAELHRMSRGSAGARTLSSMLKKEGQTVGRYKAGRLMKEAGLVSMQPSRHRYRVCEQPSMMAKNVLARGFNVAKPNKVWCGDITFIRTEKGWYYLAVVLDLYARKVVGWAFSMTADSQLTQHALTVAWHNRGRPSGILFHSDQGTQYSSHSYRATCSRYGMTASMSRKGNCWDNAVTERLFRSLKTEWLPHKGYCSAEEAKRDVSLYLSGYYNRIRPHKYNSGLSPAEKERQMQKEPLAVS